MSYGPIQIRKSHCLNRVSHVFGGNWSRISRRTDLSGDLYSIALFSDFTNMRARFFDSVPRQSFTSRLGPFPLRGRGVLGAITERVAEPG
jgi:hypothetical protein